METKTALFSLSLSDSSFERFGTAILPIEDMTPHSDRDARLDFDGDNLRYYVMRLRRRPARVLSMTRHQRATQCLGSADAQPWWMVVAEPGLAGERLSLATTRLVKVEAGVAVKLHLGTWHAGPFFRASSALFFNLELSDTNLTDHDSFRVATPIELVLD